MKNSNFNFKLVPLGSEDLGVIIGTPENEGRFILHCSSRDSVNTLVDALYYMHPNTSILDPSCVVEYYTRSAKDNSINTENTYCYEEIKNGRVPENNGFVASHALIGLYQEHGALTNVHIIPKASNSGTMLSIIADVLCTDPEHYEWEISYKEFCAVVANGCKTAIKDLGVKGYARQTGKKKPDWKRINFLLNVATE